MHLPHLSHSIGSVALDISFSMYLVLYLPQVFYNLQRRSVAGLSFLMHVIMMVGYIADIMYGFGRHMQWQYCAVSIVGFVSLSLQHFQFGYFQKITNTYIVVTALILAWLCFALVSLVRYQLSPNAYIHAGVIAWATGIIYMLPQLWKNYRLSSSLGISIVFIYFDIITSVSDTIAAWCLNWDYPSKFGSPIELILGIFLLLQVYFYRSSSKLQQVTSYSSS